MKNKEIQIDSCIGHSLIQISLSDLLAKINKAFPNKNPDEVMLNISYEQFKCFGYDLYDANDYHQVLTASLNSEKS